MSLGWRDGWIGTTPGGLLQVAGEKQGAEPRFRGPLLVCSEPRWGSTYPVVQATVSVSRDRVGVGGGTS